MNDFERWRAPEKKENNAKKFAVDLFVELHSNDKAIFVILFDLSACALKWCIANRSIAAKVFWLTFFFYFFLFLASFFDFAWMTQKTLSAPIHSFYVWCEVQNKRNPEPPTATMYRIRKALPPQTLMCLTNVPSIVVFLLSIPFIIMCLRKVRNQPQQQHQVPVKLHGCWQLTIEWTIWSGPHTNRAVCVRTEFSLHCSKIKFQGQKHANICKMVCIIFFTLQRRVRWWWWWAEH